ncbi:MAG: hypothetical protein HY321_20450 [Armatimonadetes bacterium]|nr:hypothetical protein [Armatimonadota bacterium]
MGLSDVLEEYGRGVGAWLDQCKRQTAAVQRLQKAVAAGKLRDLEKLRLAARAAADAASQRAGDCEPLEFDAAAYLSRDGGFLPELQRAADEAGVRLFERDGTIFCYPVLVRAEPELAAVRIDKNLESSIRPEALAAILKKLQSREPKSQPERFIETLYEAYELVRAHRRIREHIDLSLARIYRVLTLLPGANRDYTPLDFIRDVYILDASDTEETRKGYRMSLTASTVSRERSAPIYRFVTREGIEKDYAGIKFTPPAPALDLES